MVWDGFRGMSRGSPAAALHRAHQPRPEGVKSGHHRENAPAAIPWRVAAGHPSAYDPAHAGLPGSACGGEARGSAAAAAAAASSGGISGRQGRILRQRAAGAFACPASTCIHLLQCADLQVLPHSAATAWCDRSAGLVGCLMQQVAQQHPGHSGAALLSRCQILPQLLSPAARHGAGQRTPCTLVLADGCPTPGGTASVP